MATWSGSAPGQARKVAIVGSLDHLTRRQIVHTSPTKRRSDFIAHLSGLRRLGRVGGRNAGNPADSERVLPLLKRHIAFYGEAPPTAVSPAATNSARREGPRRPRRGLSQESWAARQGLVKSNWVYRKLRNFRAGIESDISCLKRAYGLARCVGRGLDHFRAYVWSSVVANNLALCARLMTT